MYKLWNKVGDVLMALSEILSFLALYCYGEIEHPLSQYRLARRIRKGELDGTLQKLLDKHS